MIRETVHTDSDALLAIVKNSGQFDDNGLAHVKETLDSYLEGKSGDLWFTADDGEPVGVAYCAPEPVTDGTWNLLMLWTRHDRNGQGHGSALVSHVEKVLTERDVRLLIVETSGCPNLKTRAFSMINAVSRGRRGLKTFSRRATTKSFTPKCCKKSTRKRINPENIYLLRASDLTSRIYHFSQARYD